MSESLWYVSRQLPENHAIMVCLGEGLMPKAGETPEMGSNPQLGFGRVYARPEVARWLDQRVVRLLNDPELRLGRLLRASIKAAGITVWGAAIDTLENTSRFAKGEPDRAADRAAPLRPAAARRAALRGLRRQPVPAAAPWCETAAEQARAHRLPHAARAGDRGDRAAYPGIRREHIHVWTLGGKSRAPRIGELWESGRQQGAHLVEDGWLLPTGMPAFTESGTYAPTYAIGHVDGRRRDAAPVPVRRLRRLGRGGAGGEPRRRCSASTPRWSPFTSKFDLPYEREQHVMHLDPRRAGLRERLARAARARGGRWRHGGPLPRA